MKTAAVATTAALAFSLPVCANDITSEPRGCYTSESIAIDRAGDLVIGHSEVRGVTDSVPPGTLWDKTTHHCRSVWTNSPTAFEFSNRCTNVDRDGDRFFTMAFGSSLKAFKWVYLGGTGKYAGITGGGDASIETVYPRATPTVGGACWRGKGTHSIRK